MTVGTRAPHASIVWVVVASITALLETRVAMLAGLQDLDGSVRMAFAAGKLDVPAGELEPEQAMVVVQRIGHAGTPEARLRDQRELGPVMLPVTRTTVFRPD